MRYRNFTEFYPFYLTEHAHAVNRRLHFLGTSIALLLLAIAVWRGIPWLILGAVVQGYAWAWVGHAFIEHNRPATFKYPLWSFIGDLRMWWDVLRGRVRL